MSKKRQYWILKTEPETYSWDDLVREGSTIWDGVRNHQARKYLLQMQPRDQAFIYHSGREKRIVGVAEVIDQAQWDPTATTPSNYWVAVPIKPLFPLSHPISLKEMKQDPRYQHLLLIKQPRLSVIPVDEPTFLYLLQKGQ